MSTLARRQVLTSLAGLPLAAVLADPCLAAAAAGGGGHKACLYRSLDSRQKTADEGDVGQHRSGRRLAPLQVHHAIPLGTSNTKGR